MRDIKKKKISDFKSFILIKKNMKAIGKIGIKYLCDDRVKDNIKIQINTTKRNSKFCLLLSIKYKKKINKEVNPKKNIIRTSKILLKKPKFNSVLGLFVKK